MQPDVPVEWDLIAINYTPPWQSKLLVLYCLVVLAISIARSVSVARQLWSLSPRKRVSLPQHANGSPDIHAIAAGALTNDFLYEVADSATDPATMELVRQAEIKFQYLWKMCNAKVDSLRRLAGLTFLVSVLAPALIGGSTLREVVTQKVLGPVFLAASANQVLAPFSLGTLVCVLLYAPYYIFQGRLLRRKASWEYFEARVRSAS